MWNNGGYQPLGWAGGGQQYRQWQPQVNLQAQAWAQHHQMRGYWPQQPPHPPPGFHRAARPPLLGPPPLPSSTVLGRPPLLGNPPGPPVAAAVRPPLLGNPPAPSVTIEVRPPPPLVGPPDERPPPPPGSEAEGKLNLSAPPPPPPPPADNSQHEQGVGYADMDLENEDDESPPGQPAEEKEGTTPRKNNEQINQQLSSFDKMFSNWKENYEKWKLENRNNPDRSYVESYTAQMEAMKMQLLEKRNKMNMSQTMMKNWHSEDGRVEVKPYLEPSSSSDENKSNIPSAEDLAKKLLDDDEEDVNPKMKRSRWGINDEEQNVSTKKSRWESSESSDNLDIGQMRRAPAHNSHVMNSNTRRFPFNPQNARGRGFVKRGHFNQFPGHQAQGPSSDYENFWKPSQVKDYSKSQNIPNNGHRHPPGAGRGFRPQTFDYSHGGRARGSPAGRGGGGGFQVGRSSASPSPAVVSRGKVVAVETLLTEGRLSRPAKIVIILRGVPGAGKSHLARLIKEKEVEMGGEQPRTMALDDYFECDGEYLYEPDMEDSYRANLLKRFKKNIDAGLFQFMLVDAINDKVSKFREFWSYAKQNGYEVYICTVDCDPVLAASRNTHQRTEAETVLLARGWEETPSHMNTLDVREFLQTDAIPHVEMTEADADESNGDTNEEVSEISQNDEEEDPEDLTFLTRASKWEVMDKEETLARLDGTGEKVRSRLAQHTTIEDWLELGGTEDTRGPLRQGQKRVRWADIEQRKTQARVAQLGFVVGQTNWASRRDREEAASSALTATKIIPSRWHSEFHN